MRTPSRLMTVPRVSTLQVAKWLATTDLSWSELILLAMASVVAIGVAVGIAIAVVWMCIREGIAQFWRACIPSPRSMLVLGVCGAVMGRMAWARWWHETPWLDIVWDPATVALAYAALGALCLFVLVPFRESQSRRQIELMEQIARAKAMRKFSTAMEQGGPIHPALPPRPMLAIE